MNRGLLLVSTICVSAIISSGCTTSPVSVSNAIDVPPERLLAFQDQGEHDIKITITRDKGILMSGCYLGVEIEGVLAGRFNPKETADFYIPTNKPRLSAVYDPLGQGLCSGPKPGTWGYNPVEEHYVLSEIRPNLFRISLGSGSPPRLFPVKK
ncbi:MAG: hypothetical protein P4L87_06770 [Formivibrio sp.]|nr:hypothetical protein [Formivibrio sp.]